jgi:hypothetical protein
MNPAGDDRAAPLQQSDAAPTPYRRAKQWPHRRRCRPVGCRRQRDSQLRLLLRHHGSMHLGDSVMLGAEAALHAGFANIDVDARVSRQIGVMIEIARFRREQGELGTIVVLHTGNNGYLRADQIEELCDILADVPRVLLLTVRVPREWEAPNNALIAAAAEQRANVTLVDWHAISTERADLFWNDGIHLRPEGAAFYAQVIAAAIERQASEFAVPLSFRRTVQKRADLTAGVTTVKPKLRIPYLTYFKEEVYG